MDKENCLLCTGISTTSLCIHHKNLNDEDNREENKAVLCVHHHMMLHQYLLKEALKRLSEKEILEITQRFIDFHS